MSKRLESGGNDMPEVCEGCTPKTKVELLAKRGVILWKMTVGASWWPEVRGGKRGAATAHSARIAPLLAKSFTFVFGVQP